jgi:hypothetical protein
VFATFNIDDAHADDCRDNNHDLGDDDDDDEEE